MALPLEQVVKQLEDSGIVAAGKLENFVPPKANPTSVEELVAELVKQNHLTRFQAQHVNAGKTKSLIMGGYTIIDKIGAGGMGQVFKAQHRRMERVVAIKMLPPAVTKDAAAAARFQREVVAAAKLLHPNIVSAFDADQANGAHFLVMEYVEGKDLSASVKKNGPFPVNKAINYVLQAARGLEFAHKKGVIHRDIKPANLLLGSDGTVKILDMGLARIESDGPAQTELTGTGTIMGTVDYMSPEQALNTKHADHRADIYSLGCSLYYLIAGKAAYSGETAMEKLMAHQNQPIPSLRDVKADVPEQVEAVFKKMVAKKIGDRYQSMTEVVADLEQCQAAVGASASGLNLVRKTPASDQSSDMSLLMQHQKLARIDNSDDPFAVKEPEKKKPRQARAKTKSKAGHNKSKLSPPVLIGLVAAGVLGVIVLAGVIFMLQTKDGTLIVEVNQPDAVVTISNEEGKVEISKPGGLKPVSISVVPGKHRIRVEKDGFAVITDDFEIASGGTLDIKARLVPKAAVAKTPEAVDPARTAAEWVLSLGGRVYVVASPDGTGPTTEVTVRAQLPASKFKITSVDLTACARLSARSKELLVLEPLQGIPLNLAQTGLNDADMAYVGKLSGVTFLYLNYLPAVTDQGLRSITGMSSLTYINLGSGTNVTSKGHAILKAFPKLRVVTASDLLDDEGLKTLDLPTVTAFYIYSPRVTDEGVKALGTWKQLTQLTLGGASISDQGLRHISGLTNLTSLTLRKMPKLTDEGLEHLRPLKKLTLLSLSETKVTASGVAALAKSLPNCKIDWDRAGKGPVASGQGPVASGQGPVASGQGPVKPWETPAFQAWMKTVAAMSAEKQIDAVSKKLMELNPGFDGKMTGSGGTGTPKIAGGVVTELGFFTDNVTDISPVRALVGLRTLFCAGPYIKPSYKGVLCDLSPLQGMPLTSLSCYGTQVTDLSPLEGVPLTNLNCSVTPVSDLSPLKGMKLTGLGCEVTQVSDLSPLAGMPLKNVSCGLTQVFDLTPLQNCKSLTSLLVKNTKVTAASVAALAKSLPNCQIEWDGAGKK